MKKFFVATNFNSTSLRLIGLIEGILDNYERQGYDLSLRQLYYQLIAQHYNDLPESWIDKDTGSKNNEKSYKKVGSLVNDARLAGLLDWAMIKDRGRVPVANSHWDNPGDIIDSAAYSYKINKWENQLWHVEVMVEKQALEGVLIPVCQRLDVAFTANKGYSSASALYDAGQRINHALNYGKHVAILYLGDHDPSGIDMTRDVRERLNLFSEWSDEDMERADVEIKIDRLALNFDQVEVLNPPPNPAKESDSRFDSYRNEFGETCWELDAIEPNALAQIVEDGILQYRDDEQWDDAIEEERQGRLGLKEAAKRWIEVENFLKNGKPHA